MQYWKVLNMAKAVNKSRRRFLGAAVGGAAGGLVGYVAGDYLSGIFGAAEEAARDSKVVYQFSRADNNHLEGILGSVSQGTRETYSSNLEQRSGLYKGTWDYVEALQRQALKTPGAESAPVKGARDIKKDILTWTKGLFGDEKKKDAEVQTQPQYTGNYNDLAKLRMSLMERITEIEYGMNEAAYKVRANENNTHKSDESGRVLLGDLFREHEKSFALLRGFKELKPEQISEGSNDIQYFEVIKRANEYGIKPYEPNGFLSKNAALGVTAIGFGLGAMVGDFVTTKGGYAVRTTGGAVRELGKMAWKPISWAIGSFRKK